jgi:putative NADH-flavin reductase
MDVTVFGASGKVGQQVVKLLLEEGHSVCVFIHRSNPFAGTAGVLTVQGDITKVTDIKAALEGSQAVICTLGSWHAKTKDVVTTGMRHILPVMAELGIERIVTLTGAGALWEQDKPRLLDRLSHAALKIGASKILQDGEDHLRLLAASSLDWTCIRSPIMTRQDTAHYRLGLALAMPWITIPRRAVSRCLVDQLNDRQYSRQAPVIRRK